MDTVGVTYSTYYKHLKIPDNASAKNIKLAYRRLCQQYHPDKSPNDPQAALIFQRITVAYRVLSDPRKRYEYDIWMQHRTSKTRFVPTPVSVNPAEKPLPPLSGLAGPNRWSGLCLGLVLILLAMPIGEASLDPSDISALSIESKEQAVESWANPSEAWIRENIF
jgi:DnaJ-like protein